MDPTALFLGPQGQNADVQERLALEVLRDHVHWRRGFHPEDPDAISPVRQLEPSFRLTQAGVEAALRRLLARLKGSVPFHSPRYLGHMNGDTLLPAQIGYLAAMLYNPNNVAVEGSPVTSLLESEVVEDLATLMGLDPAVAGGRLCSGGTLANLEALWLLRNLASTPLGVEGEGPEVRDVSGRRVKWGSDDPIGRLDPETLLAVWQGLTKPVDRFAPFSILVPATRHYSWDKSINVLGLPSQALVPVAVDAGLRMDLDALDATLERLAREDRPVLACVGVVGTTEGGGVDPLDGIFELRRRYVERHGRWFFVHLDAAYGGYARALWRTKDGGMRDADSLSADGLTRPGLAEAMAATSQADTVTVDPHKLGFIPYPAGALLLRDRRWRQASAFKAAYVNADDEEHVGGFMIEGSRPGAAAAACWLAHRSVPLNEHGYGRILRDSFRSAQGLAELLDDKLFGDHRCCVLERPDLDVVLYAFTPGTGATLETVNAVQKRVLRRLDPTGKGPFALSSTRLTPEVHGQAPLPFLARLGISAEEWRPGAGLTLLRTAMMTPFVADPEVKAHYRSRLAAALADAVRHEVAPDGRHVG